MEVQSADMLESEIERLNPAEILVNEDNLLPDSIGRRRKVQQQPPWLFEQETAFRQRSTSPKGYITLSGRGSWP